MTLKAKRSFWLDGGYDADAVAACPKAPEHEWWTFRIGDVVENRWNPDELMTICRACYVPRCGTTADEPDRCLRPRHHAEYHRFPLSAPFPVGGSPS